MRNRPLIWLAYQAAVSRGQAKDIGAAQHGQSGERHCQWKKCARLSHNSAKRTSLLILIYLQPGCPVQAPLGRGFPLEPISPPDEHQRSPPTLDGHERIARATRPVAK